MSIIKDEVIKERLKEIATDKGFSPSSLNTYKNCPLQFYYEKILNIKEPAVMEETIEANTLGTVVHRALEDFYHPYLNRKINTEDLKSMMPKIPAKLKELFLEEFKSGIFNKGKNKLILHCRRRIFTLFYKKKEIKLISKGNEIYIKDLEKNLKTEIYIEEIDFSVKLNGNADRIDKLNGQLRIIDYKTGKVVLGELQTDGMEKLIREKKIP